MIDMFWVEFFFRLQYLLRTYNDALATMDVPRDCFSSACVQSSPFASGQVPSMARKPETFSGNQIWTEIHTIPN